MNELINDYLQTVSRTRSPKTHKTYQQALRAFLRVVGSDAALSTETYIDFLRKTGDMNPATQSIYRVAVMGLYMFHSLHDPSINLASLKQANWQYALRKGKRFPNFDRDAIERIIKYSDTMRGDLAELRDRAFILTLADTGLRISEACSLQRGTIDWREARAIIVGKGNKEGIVYFSKRCLAALQEYLASRSKLDGASGRPLASLPLFARHDRGAGKKIKPVKAGGMWHAVKERAKEAGVDPETIRVHDFRHYFVTIVYASKRDIRLAQELARHSDIAVTSRYAHLIDGSGEAYDEIFNQDGKD
jgi:site-specific recombinase XerD